MQAASDVYSPVSGEVVGTNQELDGSPDTVLTAFTLWLIWQSAGLAEMLLVVPC